MISQLVATLFVLLSLLAGGPRGDLLADPLPAPVLLSHLPAVERYAERYDVDPRVIRAMIWIESYDRWDPIGPAGGVGYMQILPPTAEYIAGRTGMDAHLILTDPETNIAAGTWYFALWYHRFGRLDLALAAYNGGPAHVLKCLCVPPATERYVLKVLDTLGWNWPAEICLSSRGRTVCLTEHSQ